MALSIGTPVHYVSYGTPGGEYKSVCRHAVVTEYRPAVNGELTPTGFDMTVDVERVGLCVVNPTGLFFHPLSDGGCTRGYASGQFHEPGDCELT